jgi:hypothetical protein
MPVQQQYSVQEEWASRGGHSESWLAGQGVVRDSAPSETKDEREAAADQKSVI